MTHGPPNPCKCLIHTARCWQSLNSRYIAQVLPSWLGLQDSASMISCQCPLHLRFSSADMALCTCTGHRSCSCPKQTSYTLHTCCRQHTFACHMFTTHKTVLVPWLPATIEILPTVQRCSLVQAQKQNLTQNGYSCSSISCSVKGRWGNT